MLNKTPPTATSGEKSFFKRVNDFINEIPNTIGYFEPDIGGLHPDFLILSPDFGVIVVEIAFISNLPIWLEDHDSKNK